ncbi:Alpha-1,3-mannosyl-glyco 4-beta-N-acetylglucosaminyltransferase B-like protein [Clarias magur]|uniref:Alpha-1,3-mannosyl-glyco 4-beta-N-acetylglucosaminyltransferase B-like protein n=1 Tax=Clarias magur TaxID=1594786 RepID=A0A8J4U016_CLAMG|nr:Alpha-1,3-mannosyl-glyco 4-beta-N-acetylglucosaminyltransferase B-like protein [Clarias magur]
MIRNLQILALWLLTGQVDGSGVLQMPDRIYGSQGNSVEMNCRHNKDIRYRQMYWFKQIPGQGITLLVFTQVDVKPDYGEFSKDKYEAVKTVAESGSLTVKNLDPGDSALYFCAVKQHCGSLFCKNVDQSPDVICLPNESLNLTCNHRIKSYDTVLWYLRTRGDTRLKLIGNAMYNTTKKIEENFKGNFKLYGNGESSVNLEIPKASQAVHSALYFCAACYTVSHTSAPMNKNLPLTNCTSSNTCLATSQVSNHKAHIISTVHYCSLVCSDVRQTPADVMRLPDESVALTCLASAINVNQSPSDMTRMTEDSAKVSCSHDEPTYDRILWYKHSEQVFELMGNLYAKFSSIEPDYEDKIEVDGDAVKASSLTIRNLSYADTGFYFCAVRRAH